MPQQRSWFDQFNTPTVQPIRPPTVTSWFDQFNQPAESKFDSQAFVDSFGTKYDPNAPEEKPYNPAEHGYFRNALQRVIDIPSGLWEMSPQGQFEKSQKEIGKQKYLREHDPAQLATRQAQQDQEFSQQLEGMKNPWEIAKATAGALDPTGAVPGYMGIGEQSVEDIKNQNWGGLTTNAALLATPWAFGKYLKTRGIRPGLLPEEPKVNVVPPVEPIKPNTAEFDAANLGDRGSGPDLYNPTTTQGADLGPPSSGFKPWDFEKVPEHRQPWVKSGLPPVDEPSSLRTQGIGERPAVPSPTEQVKVKYRDKNGRLRTRIVEVPIPTSPVAEQAMKGTEYEGKRYGGRTISGEIASGKLKFGDTSAEDTMTGDFLGNDPFWNTIPDRLRPEPPNVTALRNLAEGTPKEGAPARSNKLNFIDEAEYLRQKEAAAAAEKKPEPTRLPNTTTKSVLTPSGEMEKIANKARFKGKSISDLAEMAKTADEPTANAIRDELTRRRGTGGTTLSSIGLGEASRILRNEFNEWRVLKNLPENEAAFQQFLEETGKGAKAAGVGIEPKVDTSVVKESVRDLPKVENPFESKGRVAQFRTEADERFKKANGLYPDEWNRYQDLSAAFQHNFRDLPEETQKAMRTEFNKLHKQFPHVQRMAKIGDIQNQIDKSIVDEPKQGQRLVGYKQTPLDPNKFHVEIYSPRSGKITPMDVEFDTYAEAEAYANRTKKSYGLDSKDARLGLKDIRVVEPRLKGLSKPDKGTTLSAGGLGESTRILTDTAGEVGGVFRRKFMKQNPVLKTIIDKLINRRSSGELIGKQVRDRFAKYGDLTTDKMVQLQNEMGEGKHPDITKFFDDMYKELTDRGIELREKENYLPQIFKEKAKEISNAFGSKTVSEKASFLLRSVIKDYAEGESKGLTPKLTPIELIEWYAKRANKLIADHEALKSLEKEGYVTRKARENIEVTTKSGKTITKKGKYIRPDGTVQLDPNLVPDGYYAHPEVKSVLENYLKSSEEASGGFWNKAEKTVGKVKNVMLSSGLIPGVPATTFHGGNFARPFSGRAFREGGLTGQYNALKYGLFPKLADRLLKEKTSAAVEATQRWGYSTNVERPTNSKIFEGEDIGRFKKTINWLADKQYKYYEGPLFDKMLPALKWTVFERNFENFISKGMSIDEAGKGAVQISDDFMSGKNVDLLYHNKNFDSAARVFLLAPNWLRSSKDLAWKIPKSFIPFLEDNKSPIAQKYRRAGARTLATYVAANVIQKALTGKFMVENKPSDIMNLQIGDDPTDSKKSMGLDWFGTAADDFEIPVKAIAAAMSPDEKAKGLGEVIANTAEYRTSPLGQAILSVFMGENFQGEKNLATTHDNFGNYIPTSTRLGNTLSQVANFGPQQLSQPINYATGRASLFEALSKMAESNLVFRNKSKIKPSFNIPVPEIKFPKRK